MKSNIYVVLMVLCAVLSSCRKEHATVFPDYDKNWLVVEDNPNDATVHDSYLFYKDTGIPVYTNDTIGSQKRIDVFGHPYTYYEVLSLSYSLGGVQSGAPPLVQSFSYCAKSDVPAALAFLKNEIIPVLPKSVHVPSILLVESLNTNAFGSVAFKGFNTIVMAQISRIPTMDQATKAAYKGAILRAMLTNAVLADKYADILDKFYSVSRKYMTTRDAYGTYIYQLSYYVSGLPDGVAATPQAIGYLDVDTRNPYYTPISTWIDVTMYLEAAMSNTDTQFRQLYGNNPVIMLKYGYIRQILTDLGIPAK
ncbi:hypothetical protein LX99_00278 [Mucilaginibacter oryzae]|uniref:Uncharacterized protein n=1 Tax=Mucilaginibacter oryzae TaxID=468058 RepID=A0A316HGT8_9SPHI|nr:hypothetical protein [Mucilaginibacter oryzae]PWK79818.1 hypothetical protein LX99_00278 [Mucilaginibacter oryzae]